MPAKPKNFSARLYARILTLIAPIYRLVYNTIGKAQREKSPHCIVLLASKPQDIELLIGLHEKASRREDVCLCFWVVEKCARRYPEILDQLKEKQAVVEQIVSFRRLWWVLNKLMRTNTFLSTVESSTAKHKLPFVITRLANSAGTATYTLQHGFENVGLNYCDEIHGPDIKFAAKTVLTWGPTENLPSWVGKETRDKAVAVGCPKKLVILENNPSVKPGERPIIGVFDNLHWHRYDGNYVSTFLTHLEKITKQHREFRFVLKSHPDSIRNRSKELATRLCSMENLDVADLLGEKEASLTTPWLLSHALGVITTPSTIALDGALAKVPVAVTRYGLDLSYYSPLSLLDSLEDWQGFLDCLSEESGIFNYRLKGEEFINRVLVPGDPSEKILDLMAGQKTNRNFS